MSFNGDLYPTAGADVVMTTKGDMVDYNTSRQRLAIGSTNQILQVKSALPSWETVDLADTVLTTAGDVLFENNTPELARLPKGSDADVLTLASGLPSWAAPSSGGVMELLDRHIATGTASTYTKTFSPALDIQSTYGKIIVFFSGVNTASLAMQVDIDGIGGYDYSKLLADTSTVSTALTTSASAFEVIGTELIDGNSRFFAGELELWSQQSSGATDRCMIRSVGWTAHEGNQINAGNPTSGDTEEIATIEVLTSTSTWTANTEIWMYGVLR